MCNAEEFLDLAAGADHEDTAASGLAKLVIEHDRSAAAAEAGYATLVGRCVAWRAHLSARA